MLPGQPREAFTFATPSGGLWCTRSGMMAEPRRSRTHCGDPWRCPLKSSSLTLSSPLPDLVPVQEDYKPHVQNFIITLGFCHHSLSRQFLPPGPPGPHSQSNRAGAQSCLGWMGRKPRRWGIIVTWNQITFNDFW